ncbi:class I SAM-dependent methyltransferase [Kibdelosporangium aridum]|uniref:Methyltransferase domain-containing protein n=1 Tax=Kibdelosporangium aridum TaxID=2030 RepID=A0A1W2CKC2_KIBAR|nr:class I SAM-dependent methyltransferase [Kibdelosporangium aridum]SMC85640.1 Methyltransferase domain-containing protein [Kibdelosporangium aridum]
MTELYGETVFGADHDLEAMRLDALSRMFDPATRARLVQIARPGMRCLDVGAGLGRISGWLAEVCAQVIAVDRDTRLLADLHKVFPTVQVVEADITEDLALGTFDIVHSRLVLMHLRDRVDVFHRLADLVSPGGWLVLGEAVEAPALISPPQSPFRQLMEKHWRSLETAIGTDGQWGYRYPDLLREAGFVDIGVEMYQPPITPSSAAGQFFQLGFHHLRDRILADGLVDEATFDEAVKAMREPGFSDLGMGLLTAWARKPT